MHSARVAACQTEWGQYCYYRRVLEDPPHGTKLWRPVIWVTCEDSDGERGRMGASRGIGSEGLFDDVSNGCCGGDVVVRMLWLRCE